MGFDDLIRQVTERARQAAEARAAAAAERRRKRQENDRYVTGGVNWDGFGLKTLIKMVAERANPGQLDALAGEWRRHGTSIAKASEDLQRSLGTLMQYWSGASAGGAERSVTRNATWIAELGDTAQQIADPIEDAGGALRSAQDTMPGAPKNAWYATAGGGAAAGFAIGGPIGAAFGAALGGIASAFGFGSNKKKLKRKAVQTMQRYEGALLGIDQTTPQFGAPADGVDPGTDPIRNPPPGVGTPTPNRPPPGGGSPIFTPGGPLPPVNDFEWDTTAPAFSGGPEARWQGLTGLGPGSGYGSGPGPGPGSTPPGFGGAFPPGGPRSGAGRGVGPGAFPPGGGRGGGADREHRGRGRGAGAMAPYGAGGRGAGADSERRARAGRGAAGGYGPGGLGRGKGGADGEHRPRGRFARAGLAGAGGYPGMGAGAGGSRKEEEDGEHRRRFPVEEDPFSTDLKAAPPVIGL